MDHDFLHVSEVGLVCDEIGVCADITPGPISRTDSQVHVMLKNSRRILAQRLHCNSELCGARR